MSIQALDQEQDLFPETLPAALSAEDHQAPGRRNDLDKLAGPSLATGPFHISQVLPAVLNNIQKRQKC